MLGDIIDDFNDNGKSIEELARKYEVLDDKTIGYLRTVEHGSADIKKAKDYQMSWGQAIKENTIGVDGLTGKLKAFGSTLSSVLISAGTMFLITAGIKLALDAIDSLVVTQEELEEAVKNSKDELNSTSSEIDNLNVELDETVSKINELQSKGTLSFTEQSELSKLQSQRKELETLIALKETSLEQQQRELALAQVALNQTYTSISHDRRTGEGLTVGQEYERYKNETYKGREVDQDYLLDSESNDITTLVIGYEQLKEQLDSLKEGTQEWADKSDEIATVQARLTELLGNQYEAVENLKAEYDKIIEKQNQGIALSTNDLNIMYAYDDAKDYIDLIQRATDPGAYNALKFDEIFNTSGIELTKEQLLEMIKAGQDIDLSNYPILAQAIEEIGFAAIDGKDNLAMFNEEIQSLTAESTSVDLDLSLADGMSDTVTMLNSMADSLSQLADLQEALGNSFTLSAEQAREFAAIYPELLQLGQVTTDGLISFNEAEVNSFIAGKQAEISADSQTRIQSLQNAKSELIAKKAEAEAKLQLAQGVANGELQLTRDKIELMGQGRQQLLDYLIQCGVSQVEAEQAANAAMQGDMVTYDKLVGQVANESANNIANSLASMATNSKVNSNGMIKNLNAVNSAAAKLAEQVNAAASGKVTGTYGGSATASGSTGQGAKIGVAATVLNGIKFNAADALKLSMDSYVDSIQLDISKYTDAISKIDAQIALIQSSANTPLKEYSSGKYTPKKSSGNKDSSKKEKEFSETFDWLSIALEKIEEKIKQLGNTASNVYKSWSTRNEALSGELTNLVDQLELQQTAYASYINKADSIGLSEHYKDLVRNGAVSIETVTDENLANRIEEYQKWYNAANELLTSIQETEESISDIYSDRFDNISKEYEDQIDMIDSYISKMEKYTDLAESKGMLASASYYEIMLGYQKDNLKNLEAERKALSENLQQALNDQSVVMYSEKWYEFQKQINEVDDAIIDTNQSMQEFNNSIRDLEWENFDYLQDTISQIATESEFLISLMENQKLVDDSGNQTKYGDATQALHGVNYNTYMSQADEYAKSIKELDNQYANDNLNKDYLERRQELVELQQDMILNAEEEKEAIKDLVLDGYEAQLESYKKLIDLKSEMLDKDKDLYDYEKAIIEKTQTLANLQKQLTAHSTDTSEESKKTVQELKLELQNAKDELEETEYEKYISDQQALLDNFADEFESWFTERLDNFDATFAEIIDRINANSAEVGETIKNSANEVGYELSDSFNTIFNAKDGEIANIISNYDNNFSNRMTTLQSAIDVIKTGISYMAAKAKAEADRIEAEQRAKEEAIRQQQAQQEAQRQQQQQAQQNQNQGGSGGSSGGDKSIFVHKKDSYPKGKLQRYLDNAWYLYNMP